MSDDRKYRNARDMRRTEFSTHPKLDTFVSKLLRRFGDPIASGRNRVVFASKNHVYKIPRNAHGIMDNGWEGSVRGECYPITRFIYIHGIPIVVAQKVDEVSTEDYDRLSEYIEWIYCIDSGQVGYTRKGRLVVFDYGPN